MVQTAELVAQTAHQLADLIKRKEASPVQIVEACLERIERLNPRLNAFISVTEKQALAQAREAEREIRGGHYRGPLHGIPYAPKDIFATQGILTTNGSKATADWIPDFDSTVIARLNEAGAILLGKLNLHEFAIGSGVDSGFGPARNPWDLEYTPGGSSSGSGAALAAELVPLSIGTDTGGSVRWPAAYSGVVGLKPTYGRVSRFGVTALSWTLDHVGPMTRSVADAAVMLQVMAGYDEKDPSSVEEGVPDYTAALDADIRGLRVGVPTNHFFEHTDPQIERAVRSAIQQLAELGAEVVDVEIPHIRYASGGTVIMRVEAACLHQKRLREDAHRLDPEVRERLEMAHFYSAIDYVQAQRSRTLLMEDMKDVFEKCDVMAIPASPQLASKLEPESSEQSSPPSALQSGPPTLQHSRLGNMTGHPAICFPCGFSTGPPKLPIGIMIYARAFDELSLLRFGHAYQAVTQWQQQRPPI